jgi:hypothetical protein
MVAQEFLVLSVGVRIPAGLPLLIKEEYLISLRLLLRG